MPLNITLILLIIGCTLTISSAKDANASLLTDADGLNVGLFEDDRVENLFGPVGTGFNADNLATGYIPNVTFGPTLPSSISDGSQIQTTFFGDSIFIRQFLTSTGNGPGGLTAITNGWNMIIEDIEWPDGSEVIAANISDSTFLADFTVSTTSTSVSLRYAGEDTIAIDDEIFATLNLVVEAPNMNVPAPAAGLLVLVGALGIIRARHARIRKSKIELLKS